MAIALGRYHTGGIEIGTSNRLSLPERDREGRQHTVCLAPTSGSSQHFYTNQLGPARTLMMGMPAKCMSNMIRLKQEC